MMDAVYDHDERWSEEFWVEFWDFDLCFMSYDMTNAYTPYPIIQSAPDLRSSLVVLCGREFGDICTVWIWACDRVSYLVMHAKITRCESMFE